MGLVTSVYCVNLSPFLHQLKQMTKSRKFLENDSNLVCSLKKANHTHLGYFTQGNTRLPVPVLGWRGRGEGGAVSWERLCLPHPADRLEGVAPRARTHLSLRGDPRCRKALPVPSQFPLRASHRASACPLGSPLFPLQRAHLDLMTRHLELARALQFTRRFQTYHSSYSTAGPPGGGRGGG